MNWKKFIRHYNGWIAFVIGTALFFIAPHLYRMVDPTAGQFDAGYIHPIIYAMTVVSFASGFAWFILKSLAPGQHAVLDHWLESKDEINSEVFIMLCAYALFMILIVAVVCFMI